MTREEEIKEQSTKYMWNQRKSHFEGYDIEYAFRAGAHYADDNPKGNLVDIDKVCEAFCKYECGGSCVSKDNCKQIIKFKQAMKGE